MVQSKDGEFVVYFVLPLVSSRSINPLLKSNHLDVYLTNHSKLQTDKRALKKRSAEGSTPSGSQSGSEQAYTPSQSQQSIMSGGPVMHIYHQQQPHHHYHHDDEEYDDDDDAYNNMFEDDEKKEEVKPV